LLDAAPGPLDNSPHQSIIDRHRPELGTAPRAVEPDPVCHQHVQVDVQVQRGPEPLNRRRRCDLSASPSASAMLLPELPPQRCDEPLDDCRQHAGRPRGAETQVPRQAEHPLPPGDIREQPIDPPRGPIRHPPATAAWLRASQAGEGPWSARHPPTLRWRKVPDIGLERPGRGRDADPRQLLLPLSWQAPAFVDDDAVPF
jgi:hypothetical protein